MREDWETDTIRPEYGQSNIHLAVIEALRQHHGTELDIHIASLSPLDKRKIFGATVHVLPGKCMFDYCYERIFVPGASEGCVIDQDFELMRAS